MAEATIGIDLGTTNSVVAATDSGGEPRVLPDEHDEKIHPSVVSFHPNGTVIVGAVAKQRRVIDPKNTVFSVKRLIGRPYQSPEVQAALERMPYRITEGPNEQPIIHTRGGQFAIPEVSAIVLDHMRAIAKRARRSETTKAVITVPANFNEGQRSATATAGAIAGLEVIRVLNEPTAAALAYGHRRNLDQLIAVYDFGGGTFDVSVLSVKDQLFEVVATAGNTFLGGDDIDETLVEHMIELFLRQENVDLRADDLAMQRLRSVAEQIKIQLSRRSRAIVKIDEIAYGPGGRGLDLNLEITREELVARCAHVVDKTFPVCDEALKLAGIKREAITDVVLVGGTTKMPYVRQRATQYFANQPRVDVNPDEAVALGAALQANVIAMAISGEASYRRVGTGGTNNETTRVDPNVSKRVASMLKQTQEKRAEQGSTSIIIEEGDTDLEFADEQTDGSGIFVTVDVGDDDEPTRAAGSDPDEPTQTAEANTKPSATDEFESDIYTATDRGWDSDGAWDTDSAWTTYPANDGDEDSTVETKEGTITSAESLHDFSSKAGRGTDRGVAVSKLPGPEDADDELTISREPPPKPMAPVQTMPLPAAVPKKPRTPSLLGRITAKRPAPPPPKPLTRPAPRAPAEPPMTAPMELMPEPPSAEQKPAPPPEPALRGAPASDPTLMARAVPPPPAAPPPTPPTAAPSARTLYDPPAPPQAPRPFTAPPAAPAGLGLGDPMTADSQPEPMAARPAVSQYGIPELGSQPFSAPQVRDVTSYTLGIGTVGGFCETIINRNTQIPSEASRTFSTSKDDQTTVRIKVFQGDSRRLDENTRLGDLVLQNLPPRPRGDAEIAVTFRLDDSGMLHVQAIDLATGNQQQASLEIRGLQSQDEVAASHNRMRGMLQ